jgi:hypothetical protein
MISARNSLVYGQEFVGLTQRLTKISNWLSPCIRIAPGPKSDASVSIVNYLLKSRRANTGVVEIATLIA